MQILNHTAAWLSDYEVYEHLSKQKEKREKLAASLKNPPRTAGNILTVEFETLQYLKSLGCDQMDGEKVLKIMEYLSQSNLTKAEKLQLLNQIPQSPVDFYLIVEECEERFETDRIEEIITQLQNIHS